MRRVLSLLSKQQPTTFKVSYAPDYKTFTLQHVANDPSHPLHETQKRRQKERKKEGLWWHATTGLDLNKSSCVRAWARRRLRNAVRDELQQRGYDATGKLVDLKAVQHRPDLLNLLQQGKTLDLTGSLRLHILPPLIPAKYTQVREETGYVIETILQAMKNEAGGQGSVKKTRSRPQWNPPPVRPPHVRRGNRPDRPIP
ncbi:Nn.00g092260.m01.CDS01 [Neocucurbitaria sp. VM-36]